MCVCAGELLWRATTPALPELAAKVRLFRVIAKKSGKKLRVRPAITRNGHRWGGRLRAGTRAAHTRLEKGELWRVPFAEVGGRMLAYGQISTAQVEIIHNLWLSTC